MSRYSAFISYSHSDQSVARWLHRAIETYRFPKPLVGTDSPFGPLTRRLPPVFRDRDELPAGSDLGLELRDSLSQSRFQIVLCSPRAAASKWVNEEIIAFKRVHGESRTLALIVSGEPYAGGERECFPPALRFRLDADGNLSDAPAEPIAADIRPGKDGRRLALLKLLAGIAGTRLDGLVRRDAARRQRRLVAITTASLAIALMTIGLAIYAEMQRRAAVAQRQLAERSLDFLVGTFNIANPATENPRTITALTILDRASKRAAIELKNEPTVSARLLRTTGEIYFNLGLQKESERDLRKALALEPARSEGRARALLKLATLAYQRADLKAMNAALASARAGYEPRASYAYAIEAELERSAGMAAYLAANYGRAAALLGGAAERFRALDGDNREDIGKILMSQAKALLQLRRFKEADAQFAAATQLYIAKFGINHFRTAIAFHNQALADFATGRDAEAARNLNRAVVIYDHVLIGDHPDFAGALLLTGRLRTRSGDEAGAIAAFDRALAMFKRLYGPDNAAIGDVDFYAAEAEAKRGDMAAALKRLAETKRTYDASYGPTDPDQAELLLQRARILAGATRFPEAQANCAAALALQKRIAEPAAVISETGATCAKMAAQR